MIFNKTASRRLAARAIAAVLCLPLWSVTAAGADIPTPSADTSAKQHRPNSGTFGGVQPMAYARITNFNSNKCLVVQGGADGAGAFQYTCLSFNDQYWQFEPTGSGHYWIRNLNSGKCLVVQGGADGAGAFQYTCLSFIDQHWEVIPDTTGVYALLRNRNSGKCLVVQGPADGSRAFQVTCDAAFADQWWYRS